MTPLLRALVAPALLLAACAAPERAPTAAELAAAESGARALVENWVSAGSEGRWDELVALYADDPDFAWIEQGQNRYPDHAAVARGLAQARDANLTLRTRVDDIVVTPLARDAAAVRADVSMVFGDPSWGRVLLRRHADRRRSGTRRPMDVSAGTFVEPASASAT